MTSVIIEVKTIVIICFANNHPATVALQWLPNREIYYGYNNSIKQR